jgi:hypothetical protein
MDEASPQRIQNAVTTLRLTLLCLSNEERKAVLDGCGVCPSCGSMVSLPSLSSKCGCPVSK